MKRLVPLAALAAACAVAVPTANAMPNFARREGVGCATCHTTIPRLNRAGYEYRAAGFRFPDKLGQEDSYKELGDLNTARIQSALAWSRSASTNSAGNTAVTAGGGISFTEATLYPATGAWGKNFASLVELSVAPEDFFEVENAYARGVFGNENQHVSVRAGVFHPWEGYGASDRTVALARPAFQTNAAKDTTLGTGQTFFTPWGFDQPGIEVNYTYGPFNAALTLFNGIFVRDEEGTLKAFPFQGGELVRPRSDPAYNAKDVQLFANMFLGEKAAVSAWLYHGAVTIPTTTASGAWTNSFDRAALYGTVPIYGPLWAQAGVEGGLDDLFDQTADAVTGNRFGSMGAFGEVYVRYNEMLGGTVRYDYFDPSTNQQNNETNAFTAAVNGALLNGAQGVLEYRLVNTSTGANANKLDHRFQLRLIAIF